MPGRYRAAAQNRRQHVDVEDCAIELLGGVDERVAIHEPARVVHQDVDPAEAREHALDHARHVARLGQVALKRRGLPPTRADLRRRGASGCAVRVVVNGDIDAVACERERRGASDADRRTGDQRDRVGEFRQCFLWFTASHARALTQFAVPRTTER